MYSETLCDTAEQGRVTVSFAKIQLETRISCDVRYGHCLQVQPTVIQASDLSRFELLGLEYMIHQIWIVHSLQRKDTRVLNFDRASIVDRNCRRDAIHFNSRCGIAECTSTRIDCETCAVMCVHASAHRNSCPVTKFCRQRRKNAVTCLIPC